MSETNRPAPGWYPTPEGQRYWNGVGWTEHLQPARASSGHLWWALSPVYTCGLVAFIPALHAAIKLNRRGLWWWAGGLIVGDVIGWVLVATGPSDPEVTSAAQSVGALLIITMAAVGTCIAFVHREAVFAPGGQSASAPVADTTQVDPAIATSLAARRRRAEATALSAQDPGLARDLMIGRPDLHRAYDDGGLVDVNHVPEAVLVSHLGVTAEQARSIVAAREHIGGFLQVEDLSNLASLPDKTLDAIRDRVVTL